MKRLTTDHPNDNMETMLNYVYGKDGWAHILHDGENADVPLTAWAKRQCKLQGCDEVCMETPEEIDDVLCDCMMDCPHCPIALAYCFASQAVHMRTRLKRYEDVLFDEAGKELLSLDDLRKLAVPNAPLTLEKLLEMADEIADDFISFVTGGVQNAATYCANMRSECCERPGYCTGYSKECKGFFPKAYRRRPEEGIT